VAATVLLVDDDEPVRRLLARALEQAGYRVMEAADGQLALEILRRHGNRIHVVVTDIRMPRFDGYQLADWMAVWDHQQPLVFITGYGQPSDRLPGRVLHKPFSTADLLLEVRRALRQVGIEPAGIASTGPMQK
jgi:CheY-like chemotaxis protein